MKNWLNKNYKILIILAFLIPIVIVAVVSISHVTIWYGISNPMSWAMYLSLGVEIAALSALAAISASMGRNVYFPFIIVTIIQFIGNIFFSYQYINIDSKIFKDWVDLVTPLLSGIGVEEGDMLAHRRFLAIFSGGLLPLISLSFLHMLVKFSEDARLHKHNVINEDNDEKVILSVKEKTYPVEDVEIKKTDLSENELKNSTTSSVIEPEIKKNEEILIYNEDDINIEETYDSSLEEGSIENDETIVENETQITQESDLSIEENNFLETVDEVEKKTDLINDNDLIPSQTIFVDNIEEPVKEIEEPIEVIEEPIEVIEEPIEVIEEPVKEIEEPIELIEEPVKEIEEPIEVKQEISKPNYEILNNMTDQEIEKKN